MFTRSVRGTTPRRVSSLFGRSQRTRRPLSASPTPHRVEKEKIPGPPISPAKYVILSGMGLFGVGLYRLYTDEAKYHPAIRHADSLLSPLTGTEFSTKGHLYLGSANDEAGHLDMEYCILSKEHGKGKVTILASRLEDGSGAATSGQPVHISHSIDQPPPETAAVADNSHDGSLEKPGPANAIQRWWSDRGSPREDPYLPGDWLILDLQVNFPHSDVCFHMDPKTHQWTQTAIAEGSIGWRDKLWTIDPRYLSSHVREWVSRPRGGAETAQIVATFGLPLAFGAYYLFVTRPKTAVVRSVRKQLLRNEKLKTLLGAPIKVTSKHTGHIAGGTANFDLAVTGKDRNGTFHFEGFRQQDGNWVIGSQGVYVEKQPRRIGIGLDPQDIRGFSTTGKKL